MLQASFNVTTARLMIRPFRDGDAACYAQIMRDERTPEEFARTEDEIDAIAPREFARKLRENKSIWLAGFLRDSEAYVLHMRLGADDKPTSLAVGYNTLAAYRGQGLMREAVKGVLPHISMETNVWEFSALAKVRNAASQFVLRDCGFRQVGAQTDMDDYLQFRFKG